MYNNFSSLALPWPIVTTYTGLLNKFSLYLHLAIKWFVIFVLSLPVFVAEDTEKCQRHAFGGAC